MIPTTIYNYRSPFGLTRGLREICRSGYGTRRLLFVAFDEHSDVHLAVADSLQDVARIKVGNKLALPWPFAGRHFYLDAVHPVARRTAVVNGDRRIGSLAGLIDTAALMAAFVQQAGDESVFFGCTPHQPGSWWVKDETATALHQRGYVDLVPCGRGLVARRTVDDGFYFLPKEEAVAGKLFDWQRVYVSPLGNLLMLERRVVKNRLVLSCQRGLIELAIEELPRVQEVGRISSTAGFAVVGRVTDGAFAVTRGTPTDWGLDQLRPADLVGSRGTSFKELGRLLHDEATS